MFNMFSHNRGGGNIGPKTIDNDTSNVSVNHIGPLNINNSTLKMVTVSGPTNIVGSTIEELDISGVLKMMYAEILRKISVAGAVTINNSTVRCTSNFASNNIMICSSQMADLIIEASSTGREVLMLSNSNVAGRIIFRSGTGVVKLFDSNIARGVEGGCVELVTRAFNNNL